jgi:hypothetical protein
MSVLHQCRYVFQRISGRRTCTKTGSTDINRIGSMVDSRHAALQILGRSQQFYLSLFNHRI